MMRWMAAYVDPGTGSFALQAAVGAVMGVSFVVRNHIKALVSRLRRGTKTNKSNETE